MIDIKVWVETTGMKTEEERFIKPPPFPYIIYKEDLDVGGADNKNCIASRDIIVELYSGKIDKVAESLIENLLNVKAIKFKRNRIWLDSEMMYETIYDFNLIEKF